MMTKRPRKASESIPYSQPTGQGTHPAPSQLTGQGTHPDPSQLTTTFAGRGLKRVNRPRSSPLEFSQSLNHMKAKADNSSDDYTVQRYKTLLV